MKATPRFDVTGEPPALLDLGHVHLIAIGGAGMSAVARLLLARGVQVSGCDRNASAALEALAEQGATVVVGHDPAHLADVDTVVVSSAIPAAHPELLAASERGIRVLHRAQALATVTSGRRRIAIAGANGKTTTTSMVAVAMAAAGLDPVLASGGDVAALGGNARWGSGDAVIEADESDGSFLAYRPDIAVVTNVQPDHLDFYGDAAGVEAGYAAFVDTMPRSGVLIACADDPGALRLADYARGRGLRVLSYGQSPSADAVISEVRAQGLGMTASLTVGDQVVPLVLAVPGLHNVSNAAAAYLVVTEVLGAGAAEVLRGLREFGGAARRFEVRGEVGGVTVVDDYAHNAPKVAALVTAARVVAGTHRLRAIFQPHLFSRTRDFAGDFAQALAGVDDLAILDIYAAREEPMPGVSSETIGSVLRDLPGERRLLVGAGRQESVAFVLDGVRPGDLVLTIGAGDVTKLGADLLTALAGREDAG